MSTRLTDAERRARSALAETKKHLKATENRLRRFGLSIERQDARIAEALHVFFGACSEAGSEQRKLEGRGQLRLIKSERPDEELAFDLGFFIEDPAPPEAIRLGWRAIELLRSLRGVDLAIWQAELDALFERWSAELRAIPRASHAEQDGVASPSEIG